MEFTIIESQRGKNPSLIKDSYRYCFQYESLNSFTTTWRCIKYPRCKAKIIKQDSIIVREDDHTCNHSHNIDRHQLRVACKRRATEDLQARPSEVIQLEMNNLSDHQLDNSDIQAVRRSIYDKRRHRPDPLYMPPEDAHQETTSDPQKTTNDESTVFYNNSEEGIIIFGTTSGLQVMHDADILLVDETFTVSEKRFKQLLTIQAWKDEWFVPAVFCLMKEKAKDIYDQILMILKGISPDLQPREVVMLESEGSAISAVQDAFPQSQILGRSWGRHFQRKSSSTECNEITSDVTNTEGTSHTESYEDTMHGEHREGDEVPVEVKMETISEPISEIPEVANEMTQEIPFFTMASTSSTPGCSNAPRKQPMTEDSEDEKAEGEMTASKYYKRLLEIEEEKLQVQKEMLKLTRWYYQKKVDALERHSSVSESGHYLKLPVDH